jgi:putative DNA primase/helicase
MPRLVRLKARPDSEIELGDALERLREAHAASVARKTGNGHDRDDEGRDLTASLSELRAAMAVIPNSDLDWNAWNRIGMALWVASSGQGFDAFDGWSRKSSKYEAETTKARWEHYSTSPPQRIGAGTIFHLANEADAGWRNRHAANERAAKSKAENEEEALLDALAKKSAIEYDRQRKQAAKQLGIRPGTLDGLIKGLRAETAAQELPCPWWEVEPWQDAVETAKLLTDLQHQLRKYVVVTEGQALTCALWTMMTWVHSRAATHSPVLMATSPQPNSGKSTLLGVLGFLTPRSLVCVGLNEAVLFRSIDLWQPTLITDEADTAFVDNEPLRAVYNSGWARGTGVLRCVGDSHTPKLFETFCPRALGLKGKNLPDTTASRCIGIEMKRKLPDETVSDFTHIDDAIFAVLRSKLARWADDNWEALSKSQPQIPAGFHNRTRRNWWLLLAIAELAGADWAGKARKAATAIERVCDTADIEIELLAATKSIFESVEEVATKTFIATLCEDEERPWATFSKGKPITDRQLARMLRKYNITSEDVYPSGVHAKGYKRLRFEDVWARYLVEPKNTS